MLKLFIRLRTMFAGKKGQGMVEYGLIIALIAVVIIGALTVMGGNISSLFDGVAGKITASTPK